MAHWYDTEGKTAYEVPNKSKGGMRPTTISDARKLDLVPSVTTIIDAAGKPALTRWQIGEGVKAAAKFPKFPTENEESWIKRVIAESQKEVQEAAALGSKIHDSLEKYFKGAEDRAYWSYIEPVIAEIKSVKSCGWVSEKSFHHALGFGGKIDLYHPEGYVWDFKTKYKETDFSKSLAYDNHALQLAAYREGLKLPTAKCFNTFICIKIPGVVQHKVWDEDDTAHAWETFKALLQYWKLANRFGHVVELPQIHHTMCMYTNYADLKAAQVASVGVQ